MAFDTDIEKLGLLRNKILEWVRDTSAGGGARDWRPESAEVLLHTIDHRNNSIRVDIWIESASIWQELGIRLLRRSRLNIAVKKWMEQLEIEYTLPVQKVDLTKGISLSPSTSLPLLSGLPQHTT